MLCMIIGDRIISFVPWSATRNKGETIGKNTKAESNFHVAKDYLFPWV